MMLSKVWRKVKNIVRRFSLLLGTNKKHITKVDYDEWGKKAQIGEFQFHFRNKWRQSDDFMIQTIKLFEHFGFNRQEYQNKTVIDIGAGSRLRSKFFIGANIIVIEPLANKFINEIKWCDLMDASVVYSLPAEERIPQCLDEADLIMSINVLDHCYDFETIIENIVAYLKKDGVAFLSFDKHDVSDEMHPLQLDEQVCERIFLEHGLMIQEFTKGANGILSTYGHGPYCLNYRLRKA